MRATILRGKAGPLLLHASMVVLLIVPCTRAHGEDLRLLFGLRGEWKFELGDDKSWSASAFDDRGWETIDAPKTWEDEGFPGYDGYAWYRKHFRAEADWGKKILILSLGRIDDVDEVFVNGKYVGSTGSFPPDYQTAYDVDRKYSLPSSLLNIPGDNVIAVRVYDDQLGGGIYEGKLGVYEDADALVPDIPLAGEWKFRTGDSLAWKNSGFDDSRWANVLVPGFWESQGYEGYDGYGWYRTTFRVPADLMNSRLILVLGKIDDFDEAYVNGHLVGKTGTVGAEIPRGSEEYRQLRAYTLLPEQVNPGGENVLAVRVYDGFRDGGIYSGPIGVVTREKYLRWKESTTRTWYDWLFR